MDLLTGIWSPLPLEAWLPYCTPGLGHPASALAHPAPLGPVLGWHDLFMVSSWRAWAIWEGMKAPVTWHIALSIKKRKILPRSVSPPKNPCVDYLISFNLCKCQLPREVFPDYGTFNRTLVTLSSLPHLALTCLCSSYWGCGSTLFWNDWMYKQGDLGARSCSTSYLFILDILFLYF